MIQRKALDRLLEALDRHAAVALLGARQVGKTTLALAAAETRDAVYLDLEAPSDRAKLAAPEVYLAAHEDRLVILDEIQRVPDLFPTLRGLIDAGRRKGRRHGRFLILGSASPDLLRQSAESLAGRILYLELGPLAAGEIEPEQHERLWCRGGFPESFLAGSDAASLEWRASFLRTYLERDIPQFGSRIPAETLRRFWTMLAHQQGALLNASRLAGGLGVSGQTVARYLDLLVDLLLVRRLAPWVSNAGKRLVRSPKTFVRDSGLVHALLGIGDRDALLGHPVVGGSYEGFVLESLIAAAPPDATPFFYRSSNGAEIDLLLELAGGERVAVEVKRSLSPRVERGFHQACAALEPQRRFVVYPGEERYPAGENVEVIGLADAVRELEALG